LTFFSNSFTLWDFLGCEEATVFTFTTKGKLELSADTIPIFGFGSGISIQDYLSVPVVPWLTSNNALKISELGRLAQLVLEDCKKKIFPRVIILL
jgi:hypothetical protein